MSKKPAKRKRKARKTDWVMVGTAITGVAIVTLILSVVILRAKLDTANAFKYLHEQQTKLALTLYEEVKLRQNAIIIDCETVKCIEQLTATGFIQIVVNGGK